MDCIIPGHSVRPFCAAIACLSRVGKDLYVDFDPLEGLTLRSLNDAKSAYCAFLWEPSFFERCTVPPSRKRTTQDENYSCRIPLRAMAAIVRPRRGVSSLRIRNDETFLSFEFRLQKSGMLRVVHRMGVADAEGVAAVAPKDGCSSIVTSPKVLLRMLEPLHKRCHEIALIVNDKYKVVTATSFHHGQAAAESTNNALLQASAANILKTETSIGCDEFEEFDFQDSRDQLEMDVPSNVNDEVAIVFGAKEAKAMLQFCAHANLDEELRVSISFHWGGKPIILETFGTSFSGQLIMATLDHKLLGGLRSVNPEVTTERNRSSSDN